MSVRIKVTYEREEELAGVIRLLSPGIRSYKVARHQKGVFKRAYIDMKDGVLPTVLVTENQEKP